MSSLNADFKELIERIRRGREFMHSSFEPIYYLVFRPEQILDVKRETPAWIAKLNNEKFLILWKGNIKVVITVIFYRRFISCYA